MDPCRRTNRVLRTFSSADIAEWGNNQFRIPFSWLSFCRNPRDSLQLICSRCNTVQTRYSAGSARLKRQRSVAQAVGNCYRKCGCSAMKMMRVHVTLWVVLLVGGFLLGFVPEYLTIGGGHRRISEGMAVGLFEYRRGDKKCEMNLDIVHTVLRQYSSSFLPFRLV